MGLVMASGAGLLLVVLLAGSRDIDRNLTRRQQAQEKMRESEAQFRTLANAIPQLCWMANGDGWILWFNERWYEYTGATPEQMEGWGWQSVHDPEALPGVLERWKVSLANGEPFDMVFPLRGADGFFRPFLTRVMPVRGLDGKIARWFGTNTDISDQKRAEAEVRKTRDLLELFIRSAPVALAMFDRNMRYIRASDQWLRDTGVEGREILGKSHYDLFPDMPAHWKGEHQRGMAGETVRAQEDWVALDGKTHTIRWEVHPWGDSGTETGGIIIAFEDITEQRKAEEALRQSEARFRRIYESGMLGVIFWNLDGAILDANDKFLEMTGYDRDDLTAGSIDWLLMTPPEYRPLDEASVEELKATGVNAAPFEKEYIRKDGSRVPIIVTGAMLDEARFNGVALAMDITERKQAEEARAQTNAQLEGILGSIPEPVMVMDENRHLVKSNHVFERRHLATALGTLGECYPAVHLFTEDGHPVPPEMWPLNRAIKGERISGLTLRLTFGNGGPPRFYRHSASPIYDRNGRVTHAVLVFFDVTENRLAEEEIRRLNADLEDRVRRRTTQLEAANKELEAFAYSVSHDLRTPLRGIDGWSLALVEDYGGQLDEKAHGYVDRVRAEEQRMGALIDDLLQLSRVIRSEMAAGAVDLTSIARTIAARLTEDNSGRRIEFTIAGGLAANGDARLLEIALENLFGNAVKFTGPRAEARIEFGRAGGDGERPFYVRDNGVGFDMAFAGTLFGAFQRLHRASEFPGTGIGLATVQRIIHRHGGRVWAEAKPDRGATFYFTLGGS
jgi:PAS domain S-box-containing protein